jgi:hypothetical protein
VNYVLILYKALKTAMIAAFVMSLATYLILGQERFLIPAGLTALGWILLAYNQPRE